jgi:hypothetical protein
MILHTTLGYVSVIDEPTGSLISHGELEIARFTEAGEIAWQSSGRDIFTGELILGEQSLAITDFDGVQYRFRYSDGRYCEQTGIR